ncbi:hypothetical protein DFP73DRAFT_570268 [Morchella snyderi]|nr:hypothetical protein DFP73DRAFT_570268 [Morchella snyderi]
MLYFSIILRVFDFLSLFFSPFSFFFVCYCLASYLSHRYSRYRRGEDNPLNSRGLFPFPLPFSIAAILDIEGLY